MKFLTIAVLFCLSGWASELKTLAEFFRPDPFGAIVESDREGAQWSDSIRVSAARGGYVSFHLVARAVRGAYQISVDLPLTADLYREWFHFSPADKRHYPDALIPVEPPYRSQIPEPDNAIDGQTAQSFWVDVWIPASTEPKVYQGRARLTSGGGESVVPIEITVLPATVPPADAVVLDNNSYGTSWLLEQYPKTLAQLDRAGGDAALFKLIHAYHRIFYEHRGTFHQLGYGHAGKVGPEFAPELKGSGKNKHIASWDVFDRHYGPLLDGSAFKDTRRGPRPIPFVYLPINPEWPASFLWWGEPGYQAEFVNVVSEMEQHFREKHWTSTHLEVFFNQKKRYKGFAWDGDEVRFAADNRYFQEYNDLLHKAVPADSPVQFVMRADTSWSMEQQFQVLKGVVRFWVAGEGMLTWYPNAVAQLKQRGDIVWTYGGTPPVRNVSTEMTLNPLRSWIHGVDGFVRWLTVSPGPEPWFHFGGGEETLVYSGERFGIPEPLASIRLKIQRNCLQDLALLEIGAARTSRDRVQAEVVRRFNGTTLATWSNVRPRLADTPVLEWNNTDISEAESAYEERFKNLSPSAWLRVREFALEVNR